MPANSDCAQSRFLKTSLKLHFMRIRIHVFLYAAVALLAAASICRAADNELTDAEKAGGWKLLFDGKSLAGWRSYGKPDGPTHGWEVKDGVLNCIAGAKGGDIVSTDK